jgi:hypothetical protein
MGSFLMFVGGAVVIIWALRVILGIVASFK